MKTTATIVAAGESGERFSWDCDAKDLDAEVAEAEAAGLIILDVE